MPFSRRTLIASATGLIGASGAGLIETMGTGPARAAPTPTPPTAPERAPETIRLWPGEAPGTSLRVPRPDLRRVGPPGRREYRLKGVSAPVLYAYRPARPNGAGVIVMPGGGYAFLSIENEGTTIARMLAAMGYTVFVLGYRLPDEGWANRADAPLQDAQRAIRLVRERAKSFAIDPERVGVLGFSAGGHLAASLVTDFGEALYEPIDAADRRSAAPTFAGLMYAVTTLREPQQHSGSHDNLLGTAPAAEEVDRRSPLLHVRPGLAPCFLVHALDDPIVHPSCSVDWMLACRQNRIPVEAHFLERGGHGFGVGLPPANPGSLWPRQFQLWVQRHGG